MNCNKCGTPILPGEHICRFCGSVDDFSERKIIEPTPEIIDFEIEENNDIEIIDFALGEDEVSIDPEPNEYNKDDYEFADDVLAEIDEPETVRIPLEDIKNAIDEAKEIKEEAEPIKEEIKEEVKEPILEEIKEEDEEDKEEPKESKGSLILTIILVILLVASIILNIYFLMNYTNNKKNEQNTVANSLVTTIYNDYKIDLPNNWNTEVKDDYLLVYDETNTWAASLTFSEELDYSKIKDNSSNIMTKYNNDRYLLSSDYTKTVKDKEFYIFRGRYYDKYITFLGFTKINDDLTVIMDLKFKSNIDEELTEKLYEVIANITPSNISLLEKDNFAFDNVNDIAKTIIMKDEKEN